MEKRNYNIIFRNESPEKMEAKYGPHIPSEDYNNGSKAPDAYRVPIEDKYILNGNNWIFPENPTDDAIYKYDQNDDVYKKFSEFFIEYPPLEEDKQNIKNFLKNFINKNNLNICDGNIINKLVIVTPEAELRNSLRFSTNPLLIYMINHDKSMDFTEDEDGNRIPIEEQIPESERHKYQDTMEDIIKELCKENINIKKELPMSHVLKVLPILPPGHYGEDYPGGEEYHETVTKWEKNKGGNSRKHKSKKHKSNKSKKHKSNKSKKHKSKKHKIGN